MGYFEAHLHELRGAPELEPAYEQPQVHQIVERVQPETAQSRGVGGAQLLRVQLRSDSPYTSDQPGDGCWRYDSPMGRVRHRGASSTGRVEEGRMTSSTNAWKRKSAKKR